METTFFHSLNFKLVVIEELRDLGYFKTDFDELLEKYWDDDNFDYEPIPEILDFCKKITLTDAMLSKVKRLVFDGGNEIYHDIIPNWDGEDAVFDVKSIVDVDKLPNLEKFIETSILDNVDYSPLLALANLREAHYLSCDETVKEKLILKGVDVK